MFFVLLLIITVVYNLVVQWRVFTKAGVHGIWAIIPFCNIWHYNTIAGFPGWLIFIPVIGSMAIFIDLYLISRKFGLGKGLSLIGIILSLVPMSCIAFNPYVEYDFDKE